MHHVKGGSQQAARPQEQQQQQQQIDLQQQQVLLSHQQRQRQQSGMGWRQQTQQQRHQRHNQRQLPVLFVVLLASAALWLQPAAAWGRDTELALGTGVYNPSLVVYQGSAWAVARSTQLKWDTSGLKWIVNRAHLCNINTTDWSTISCHAFDPWRGRYGVQCRWGSDSWQVPWEAWGVDDTKLFVWPGRGLWAITGRRPERDADSKYCPQVIWQQWLVQLADEGTLPDPTHFNFPVHEDSIPGVTWAAAADTPKQAAGGKSTGSSLMAALRRLLLLQPPAEPLGDYVGVLDAAEGELDAEDEKQPQQPQQQVQKQQKPKGRRRPGGRRKRRHRRPAARAKSAGAAGALLPGPVPKALLPATTPQLGSLQTGSANWAALRGARPVPLRLADAAVVYGSSYAVTEKNWMPFVFQGQLLVSYTLAPKHVVYQLQPSGLAERRFETDTSAVFARLGAAAASKMHGGPPMVHIDASLLRQPSASPASSSQASYYLGVAHYWELPAGVSNSSSAHRVYKHYLVKVEAQPPFKILKVSKELPLKLNDHYKQVAFVSGLHLAMLPAGAAAATTSGSSTSTSQPTAAAAALDPQRLADVGPSSEAVESGVQPATAARRTLRSTAAAHAHQQHARHLLQQPSAAALAALAAAPPAASDSTGSLMDDVDADEFTWLVDRRPADVNIFSWAVTPQPKAAATTAAAAVTPPQPAAAAATSAAATSLPSTPDTAGPFVNMSEAAPPPRAAPSPSVQEPLLPEDPPLPPPPTAAPPPAPALPATTSSSTASGLVPHVLLSYGSGDWGARVVVMTLQDVEDMFAAV